MCSKILKLNLMILATKPRKDICIYSTSTISILNIYCEAYQIELSCNL